MISCIILDDEPLAIKVIENFIKKIDYLECVGTFSNANDALSTLKKEKIELMFLDINMPFIDGITFLKKLENPPKTIITSAHSEYALDGYDLDVVDYLMKPIPFERFEIAVSKAYKIITRLRKEKSLELDFVFVRVNKLNVKINYDDILDESLKDYIKIVTKSKISLYTQL